MLWVNYLHVERPPTDLAKHAVGPALERVELIVGNASGHALQSISNWPGRLPPHDPVAEVACVGGGEAVAFDGVAVIAYPESRRGEIDGPLAQIISQNGGTELDSQSAEHEWEQRFAPMRLKRIGPSIVPTEVVVPLAEMPAP